jgi:hypothetical protein
MVIKEKIMNNKFDKFYLLHSKHFIILTSSKDADSSTFTYSAPLCYNNQLPVFFKAYGGFLSYKILKDKGKYNKVIKFDIPPIKKDEKIKIHFEYWVLIKKDYKRVLPEVYIPIKKDKIPADARVWLVSTKSIQSNNPLIKTAAHIMKGFNKDLFSYVKKVMIWIAFRKSLFAFLKSSIVEYPFLNKLILPDRYWMNLEDAFSSFILGSLCVGHANLVAAMLRNMGIPARVLISDNTFFGKDFYMDAQHFFNEFYCPEFGWIQSQPGKLFLPQGTNIVIRILEPEDEDLAGNGVGGYGGSAPWFWFGNEDVFFAIPEGCMEYRLPKSKKVGVPTLRVWTEGEFDISSNLSNDIIKLTSDVWELFTINTGQSYTSLKHPFFIGLKFQNKALKRLTQNDFEGYIDMMKKALDFYQKI